ncbi:adenylosuccinate lyase [Calycina marina]|uniref:Adenylosuccinate lyase n=1 Tax=Calycina marina TaxID=1763456 RepID=A0A9P8CJY6_9HELO|nr:adenylosuccinate lyase [Calycina marina]
MAELDNYQTPLATRYASKEMRTIFSARTRGTTWRQLWIALAEAEKELGIDISDEAIVEMKAHAEMTNEDFVVAAEEEKRRRHDVMAHVHAFGQVAPKAAAIIHYGATSCYVTDNADLIFQKRALELLIPKIATIISKLSESAVKYKDVPTLGYTHYQPAQCITVGRRIAQWVQDLEMDLVDIQRVLDDLKFRGAQGTTGTQASFMAIFDNDGEKIDKLNKIICAKFDFSACYSISTQTYSRKVDLRIANAISGYGTTVQRITSDIRHLAHQKEMEEPFEKDQIGSSAMAYKRNPMRCERIAGLGRHLANLNKNASDTYAAQWFERTLDDSAIRRITIPESFLTADAISLTLDNVVSGLVVYEARVRSRLMEELPFMATENIIMKMVSFGGSRQEAHEEIRVLSHQAAHVVKNEGGKNNLIELIKKTEYFRPVWAEVDAMLDPELFVGRSALQVERYCGKGGEIEKALTPYRAHIDKSKAIELTI